MHGVDTAGRPEGSSLVAKKVVACLVRHCVVVACEIGVKGEVWDEKWRGCFVPIERVAEVGGDVDICQRAYYWR